MTLTEAEEIEPPNINQPVLLEVQAIQVNNNVVAKVMWDNGSSGALITHYCAERIGATGQRVSYWLDDDQPSQMLHPKCLTDLLVISTY